MGVKCAILFRLWSIEINFAFGQEWCIKVLRLHGIKNFIKESPGFARVVVVMVVFLNVQYLVVGSFGGGHRNFIMTRVWGGEGDATVGWMIVRWWRGVWWCYRRRVS